MNYNITKEEFAVLTYLHDNAEAFDQSSAFPVEEIAKEIGIPVKEVTKAASFLKSWNVAGVAGGRFPVTLENKIERNLFLTVEGEHFMREVESQLAEEIESSGGTAKKITVKIASVVYDLGKAVIVKTLTNVITGSGRH